MAVVNSSLFLLELDMLAGMTHKIFKSAAILCMCVVFVLGLSCQLHASPHVHGMSSSGHDDHHHHDETSSSTIDDIACLAAVIPSINQLFDLSALKHAVSLLSMKPLVPAFELFIPPRSSL